LASTEDGPRLVFQPVKEIEELYMNTFSFQDKGIEELERIPSNVLGEGMHIRMQFGVANRKLLAVAVRGILMVYDPIERQLLLPCGAFSVGCKDDRFDLEIVTDRGSVEIFANGGLFRTVLNTVLDPMKTGIDVVLLDQSTPVSFSCSKLNTIH
jgi:hypothetical protein